MAIAYAHEKGFVTRIVTNAWWASSLEKAQMWCKKFVDCGLDEINISYDDFHAEYLNSFGGEANIRYACEAIKDTKLNLLIGMVLSPQHIIDRNYIEKNILKDIQCFEGQIAPFGRDRELLTDTFFSTNYITRVFIESG